MPLGETPGSTPRRDHADLTVVTTSLPIEKFGDVTSPCSPSHRCFNPLDFHTQSAVVDVPLGSPTPIRGARATRLGHAGEQRRVSSPHIADANVIEMFKTEAIPNFTSASLSH